MLLGVVLVNMYITLRKRPDISRRFLATRLTRCVFFFGGLDELQQRSLIRFLKIPYRLEWRTMVNELLLTVYRFKKRSLLENNNHIFTLLIHVCRGLPKPWFTVGKSSPFIFLEGNPFLTSYYPHTIISV